MKYFIGYLIRGEAAEYYRLTGAELANSFRVDDVSRIAPPHMTVKATFDHGNQEALEEVLSAFADTARPCPLSLSGWNHFGNRTIIVDAPVQPNEAIASFGRLIDSLRSAGVRANPREKQIHAHMSVARFLTPEIFPKVWAHIEKGPKPSFDMMLDNVTLFSSVDGKIWKVEKTFPFMGR
jgi:2'-5' RNA ligase